MPAVLGPLTNQTGGGLYKIVALVYDDIGLFDGLSVTSCIEWYQLIPLC